jgi:hypothetical protein
MNVVFHLHNYHLAVAQRWKRIVWTERKLLEKLTNRYHRLLVRCDLYGIARRSGIW